MYYPSSQITVDLYTNGEEFAIASTNQAYSGYYWKTSQGKFFTGKNPQDTPIQKLIRINNNEIPLDTISYTELVTTNLNGFIYNNIKRKIYKSLQLPTYSPNIPTENDYKNGEYIRYFCKKTNELLYLEIDKDTYDKLVDQDLSIYYQLYLPFNIFWKLTGDKEQVFKSNKNIVELIMKQQKLFQFDLYLKKDYIKYYK